MRWTASLRDMCWHVQAHGKTGGEAQEWVRAMLGTVGRGGNAQVHYFLQTMQSGMHLLVILSFFAKVRSCIDELNMIDPQSCNAQLCSSFDWWWQAVRDEILNIMHRNNIGEKRGTWMEDWHQKLHNNTTPDDVAICEAFIAFLEASGDNGVYWRVLSDAGVGPPSPS